MTPASNNKCSEVAMKESFLYSSNIVPQDLDNNMFYWNRMEMWVRNLVIKKGFDNVHVLSGPLFLPTRTSPNGTIINGSKSGTELVPVATNFGNDSIPKEMLPPDVFHPTASPPSSPKSQMIPGKPFGFVSYKTIGETSVAVPTHLFKAVLAEKSNGPSQPPTLFFASFIVPNSPIAEHLPLRAFQVPKEVLEKYGSFAVYDRAFQTNTILDLCTIMDPNASKSAQEKSICALENATDFKLFTLERDLKKVKSKEELERVMADMHRTAQKGGKTIPASAQTLYDRLKREL
jgi:DNA/RNA endonuclease G (NUC1)